MGTGPVPEGPQALGRCVSSANASNEIAQPEVILAEYASSNNDQLQTGITMKKVLLCFAIGLGLQGCATYDLALMPRGPGAMAHGTAKQIDKSVSIALDGETYAGRYAYVQGGTFTLGTAFGGGQVATGSAVGVSAVGNGNVLASSADGHNLRCVFSFSGWTQQGTGACLTDTGGVYDLQISR